MQATRKPSVWLLAFGWIGGWLCCGCGVQLLGGGQFHAPRNDRPIVMDIGTRFVQTRGSGPYLGADAVVTLPPIADARFHLRHIAIAGGYRWLLYPVSLELGPQLGAGQPAYDDWNRTGVYLGLAANVLVRVSGDHDALDGYAPAGLLIDLAVGGSAGVWSAMGHDNAPDGMLLAGIRFTLVSDIVVPSKQGWVPP
jgi:hypothetical protein